MKKIQEFYESYKDFKETILMDCLDLNSGCFATKIVYIIIKYLHWVLLLMELFIIISLLTEFDSNNGIGIIIGGLILGVLYKSIVGILLLGLVLFLLLLYEGISKQLSSIYLENELYSAFSEVDFIDRIIKQLFDQTFSYEQLADASNNLENSDNQSLDE